MALVSRLIDGKPTDSGKRISRRTSLLMVPAMILANGVGAGLVMVLAGFVLPGPELDDEDRILLVNVVVFGAYLTMALLVGSVWGEKRFAVTRAWLREERPPDDREIRIALRDPRRVLGVTAFFWGAAVILFAGLNAAFSPVLALEVGMTVLLGGITTSAIAYLLTVRIMRASAARALQHGAPAKPVLPGVMTRGMLGWALGSGVPLVGLAMVAVAALVSDEVSGEELAISVLALGGVGVAVGFLISWLTARATADPVVSVRKALAEVEQGDLDREVPVYDGSELGLLQAGFNRMAAGLRERERVRDLFGRHVGEEVARAALDQEVELGGEVREVAAVFVDVEGSTRMASERPPSEVVALLNSFFAVVIDVVDENGGFVNKFQGDAALVVFGAPIARADYASRALATARELAARLREELPDVPAGIGASGGSAVAGNIGDERRFEYTVIGDPVNEAARLTELAKERPERVLASAALLERADESEAGRWKLVEATTLRGRSEETRMAVPLPP